MASPGYGKRSVAGQPGPSADDFALLPGREAAIAGFIDRLPDGADISVKALAKVMDYGQCALRTALNLLERAGHLLRRRELVVGPGGARWVTRTWFSRAAREGEAWTAQPSGGASETAAETETAASTGPGAAPSGPAPAPAQAPGAAPSGPEAAPSGPAPAPAPGAAQAPGAPTSPAPAPGAAPVRRAVRSRGYLLLASVGRRCPALSLSAAECAELEPLAAEWFVRGAGEEELLRALTGGLPVPVHHPAGLVRSRLTAKLPPEPVDVPVAPGPVVGVVGIVECANCRAPGRPGALVDGECGACRGAPVTVRHPAALPPERVRVRVAELRSAAAGG
ncbi:hypothetical protein ACIQ7D_09210 [Streptomyces sp. NPDC096310]|uniref:hypothetical protein n=1 Tax=Streptomyces sp. NPDC096310 TaxID=3366082 RepID=UPI0037F9B1F6